jgi:lysozyme family protein
MAESNFPRCLKEVLKHEGGYVDHPRDPGGATNMGVTKKAWEEYVGKEVTKDDIKNLTVADITPFYRKRYWDACRCDWLDSGLDYVVFDIAVNSGPRRAGIFLQNAVGAVADGRIGPATLSAVEHSTLSTKELIDVICNRRQKFWESTVDKEGKPLYPVFGRGWTRRGEEVRKKALEMAG